MATQARAAAEGQVDSYGVQFPSPLSSGDPADWARAEAPSGASSLPLQRAPESSGTQSRASPKLSQATKTAADLKRDLRELRKLRLSKGELETSAEYDVRIRRLYQKYDGRIYTVSLTVKEVNKDSNAKMVYFEPDSRTLYVAMPRLDFATVSLNVRGETKSFRLTHSFLPLESKVKRSSYAAQNGFGYETEVEEIERTHIGISLMGKPSRDMTRQIYSTLVSRDRVRSILDKGKILLTVRAELLQSGEESYMVDDSGLSQKKVSLLVWHRYRREPTVSSPYDFEETKYSLPVRLLSVSLLDGVSREVFRAEGTEIDTQALEER